MVDYHFVFDFVNLENWEYPLNWPDVDRDAYGVVLGFAVVVLVVVLIVVVVAAVVTVLVVVFVFLLEFWIQTLAFQLMLFGFHGMDQNLNHLLQISLPEVQQQLVACSFPVCMFVDL